jgi:hypothetical protein
MKTRTLQFLFVLVYVGVLRAADISFLLTAEDAADVKQKLMLFEKDQITLTNLTDSPDGCLKIMTYFLTHTNEVTTKMKLPISRSFANWSKYPEAAKLAQEYLNVYSNDWRGWRVLGGTKVLMKSYDEAIVALTNAIRLGDDENYIALGGAALAVERMDVFESMVAPHLLVMLDDTKRYTEEKRFEMRGVLLAYALNVKKQGIFVKAADGFDAKDILANEGLRDQIAYGCEMFKGKDIDKIRQKLETGTGNNSSLSDTNSSPQSSVK